MHKPDESAGYSSPLNEQSVTHPGLDSIKGADFYDATEVSQALYIGPSVGRNVTVDASITADQGEGSEKDSLVEDSDVVVTKETSPLHWVKERFRKAAATGAVHDLCTQTQTALETASALANGDAKANDVALAVTCTSQTQKLNSSQKTKVVTSQATLTPESAADMHFGQTAEDSQQLSLQSEDGGPGKQVRFLTTPSTRRRPRTSPESIEELDNSFEDRTCARTVDSTPAVTGGDLMTTSTPGTAQTVQSSDVVGNTPATNRSIVSDTPGTNQTQVTETDGVPSPADTAMRSIYEWEPPPSVSPRSSSKEWVVTSLFGSHSHSDADNTPSPVCALAENTAAASEPRKQSRARVLKRALSFPEASVDTPGVEARSTSPCNSPLTTSKDTEAIAVTSLPATELSQTQIAAAGEDNFSCNSGSNQDETDDREFWSENILDPTQWADQPTSPVLGSCFIVSNILDD